MDVAGLEAFRLALQSAARALAGEPRLQVDFSGPRVLAAGLALHLPARVRVPRGAAATRLRGAADLFALRHRHHDRALHALLRPAQAVAGALFDALEDVRVAVVGTRGMPGASRNIAALLRARLRSPGAERREAGCSTVAALARELHSALLARSLEPAACNPVQCSGSALRPADIERFRSDLDCQRAFAATGLAWLRTAGWLGAEHTLETAADVPDDGERTPVPSCPFADGSDAQLSTMAPVQIGSVGGASGPAVAEKRDGDDDGSGDGDGVGNAEGNRGVAAGAGTPGGVTSQQSGYRVFDRSHDEVLAATALVGADRRAMLRRQLDSQSAQLHAQLGPRLRRLLRRLDPARHKRWRVGLEEGALDPARLAALVADPQARRTHRQRSATGPADVGLTLLVDNSGSMRGAPITAAAAAVDVLAPVLERLGVNVEILGFTTGAWMGGRPRERWVAEGNPPTPGRLNQLRHIVYKQPDQCWAAARRSLGAMLDARLLKENIDGEALEWAHAQLLRRAHGRRILVMLCDGLPSDTATERASGGGYLHRHLQDVIDRIQARQAVELVAIGTDPGVAVLYRRAIVLPGPDDWGGALLDALAGLFATPAAAFHHPRRRI